jgi:predicted nucleotidyltransferase component of viral defense system
MLYLESIQPGTLGILKKLMQDDFLKRFYLVGGTALALHLGHRISEDIDLFTDDHYELTELKAYLQKEYQADIYSESTIGIRCLIEGIKTDFLNYPYPAIEPVQIIQDLRFMAIPDIAAMKLAAINNRGAKRDFFDLYFLCRQFRLPQLIDFFTRKYKITSLFPLYTSLTYFDDAEKDTDPVLLKEKNLTWNQVKNFITQKVKQDLL